MLHISEIRSAAVRPAVWTEVWNFWPWMRLPNGDFIYPNRDKIELRWDGTNWQLRRTPETQSQYVDRQW
jgi:hypothetical protein